MVFKRIRKALKSLGPGSSAFVAIHETDLDVTPKELFDAIDGITAVQPIRGDNGKLSYLVFWSSPAQYSAANTVIQRRLGGSVVLLTGVAGESIAKPVGVLGKLKGNAVPILFSTAAILTAIGVLSNHLDTLIAAPQFAIRLDELQYEIDEGDELSSVLSVDNAMPSAPLAELHITPNLAAARDAASESGVRLHDPQGTSILATRSRSFLMSADGLAPGEHALSVAVRAKAGLCRSPVEQVANARVIVWPKAPQAHIALKQVKQNRADFSWALRVGEVESSGVVCDLVLSSDRFSVSTGYWRPIDGLSNGEWDTVGDEAPVARLRVTWPLVKSRSSHLAVFSLIGSASTDWSKVEGLKPTCSIVRKS